jgi:hypothetical protein
MYLPYGVSDDGQLVYIESVARGKTTLRCPYCHMPLIARKGEQLAPHFAHDGKTCREVKRASDAIALPVYDSFRLHLAGKLWEALRRFHDEDDPRDCEWLEREGLVTRFISPYGNARYNLTHKGKIPFGELSLNLFNQFQAPLIQARHDDLQRMARRALGEAHEAMLLTDLKLFRAQMRRILATTLYFIEVQTGDGVMHKIGVTTRPLEQRLAEIRADLLLHIGRVELRPLGTWAQRGNVELYFKHRYRRFQQQIGTLTEYFAFRDVKSILRDLRRMQPKALNAVERGILAGEPSLAEIREPQPHEMLSPQAWHVLSHLTDERHDMDNKTWHELHNYCWEGEHRRLIEPTAGTSGYQTRRTIFGDAYHAAFAAFYERQY